MIQTAFDRQAVGQIASQHRTLEQILNWGLAQIPPLLIKEVIPQDEFTNDVILPCGDFFLVYDVT